MEMELSVSYSRAQNTQSPIIILRGRVRSTTRDNVVDLEDQRRVYSFKRLFNPLITTVAIGTAIKHSVPDRVKLSFVIFDIRAVRPERQSARMSKIHVLLVHLLSARYLDASLLKHLTTSSKHICLYTSPAFLAPCVIM